MSLLVVPGSFNNEVFVCLGAAKDDDMIFSASTVVLAAAVGVDAITSLMVVEFLITAGADGELTLPVGAGILLSTADNGTVEVLCWVDLSCGLSMFGSPDPMMMSSIASC